MADIAVSTIGCMLAPAAAALAPSACFKRLLHRLRQTAVGLRGLGVELRLSLQQTFVELLVALLDLLRHRLQLPRDLGQGLRLRLQRPEALLALPGKGERQQRAGDGAIELPRRLEPLAATDDGHQAQHGRSRHTGHRGAKGKRQPANGLGQRRTNRLQVRGTLQREHGALESEHHAEEGAEHAEHHQQTDQVGRDAQARQGAALALDTQAHRTAQRRVHAVEPVLQLQQGLRDVVQRPQQRQRELAKTQHLGCPQQVGAGDGQRHCQCNGTGTHESRPDPRNAGQPEDEQGANHDASH
jgi:hypothetical protein